MEYKKAKLLNSQLLFWMNTCVDILETTGPGREYPSIEELKAQFADDDFNQMYDNFIEELKDNIREYRNIEYMDKYMEGAFSVLDDDIVYEDDIDIDIVKNGYEVKFLLSTTKVINRTLEKVRTIFYGKEGYTYSDELKRIFYEEMLQLQPDFQQSDIKDGEENNDEEEYEITLEDRKFNFKYFKNELALIEGNKEKINLITNRLIDFEQWFIGKGGDYTQAFLGTRNYVYAEFYKLCMSETKRYPIAKEPQPQKETKSQEFKNLYSWTGSDTDLLELIVSLFHSGSIERKDDKTFTRKELTDYFQGLFGLEIKDVEGKLTRATGRKMNMTPFLDNLKVAFENYRDEKEEKQQKRK